MIIHGRVQGIGYRWFVREQASKLGLSGWVMNRSDGTVELEAQGRKEALDQFGKLLRSGHAYAQVDRIESMDVDPARESRDFTIRSGS